MEAAGRGRYTHPAAAAPGYGQLQGGPGGGWTGPPPRRTPDTVKSQEGEEGEAGRVGGQGREGGQTDLPTGGQQQGAIVQNAEEIKGIETEERRVSRLRLRWQFRGADMSCDSPYSLGCCHPRVPRLAAQEWLYLTPEIHPKIFVHIFAFVGEPKHHGRTQPILTLLRSGRRSVGRRANNSASCRAAVRRVTLLEPAEESEGGRKHKKRERKIRTHRNGKRERILSSSVIRRSNRVPPGFWTEVPVAIQGYQNVVTTPTRRRRGSTCSSYVPSGHLFYKFDHKSGAPLSAERPRSSRNSALHSTPLHHSRSHGSNCLRTDACRWHRRSANCGGWQKQDGRMAECDRIASRYRWGTR